MQKFSRNEECAYLLGYRVTNGEIISGHGKKRKYYINKDGYPEITFIDNRRRRRHLPIHRMVAYQKFGDKIYEKGIEVRHLDGNSKNFDEKNIAIGTHSENLMDIPKQKRLEFSLNASAKLRKFTDTQVEEIRTQHESGDSYNVLMDRWGITSKGTMSYIINHKYKTKK